MIRAWNKCLSGVFLCVRDTQGWVTPGRRVSWVSMWKSRSSWGCLRWLGAEAVPLLVIMWPFSHVEMSVSLTKLSFLPVWNHDAFASGGRKTLVLGTEIRRALSSHLHMPSHGAVSMRVSVLGSWWSDHCKLRHCCWCIAWTLTIVAWLGLAMHIVMELISRNKEVAKWELFSFWVLMPPWNGWGRSYSYSEWRFIVQNISSDVSMMGALIFLK